MGWGTVGVSSIRPSSEDVTPMAAEPLPAGASDQPGPSQLGALFRAIEARFGRQVASEIWLQVFGQHDADAQT